MPVLAVLAVLVAPHSSGYPQDPRQIVLTATRAVEVDSPGHATGLPEFTLDQARALARATTLRLTYDYPAADSLYSGLTGNLNSPDRFTIYARLGQAAAAAGQGQLARSDSLYQLAATLALGLNDSAAQAEALLGQATARARLAGPAPALALLETGRQLVPGDDARLLLGFECRRAMLLATLARPQAKAVARLGIEQATRLRDYAARGLCTHALARHFEWSDPDSTVATLALAAEDFRRVHDRARRAAILQGRGYLLVSLGEYGEALEDLESAVAEARASRSLPVQAWASINLAQVFLPFGDLEEAGQHLARAESLLVAQSDQYGLFVLRGVTAWFREAAGDTGGARADYNQGIRDAPRFAPPLEFLYRRKLADLDRRSGDWRGARQELERAREGYRRLRMTPFDQNLEYHFGVAALTAGDLEAAERSFIAHARGLGPGQRARRYLTTVRLAEVLARRGRVADAERVLGEATDSLEAWKRSLRDRQLRQLSFEMRQEDSDDDLGAGTVLAGAIASGRTDAALVLAERYRARELLDRMVQREGLVNHAGRLMPPPPSVISPGQLQAAIPDGRTALLAYVAGGHRSPGILFVVTGERITGHILEASPDLAQEIARLQTVLTSGKVLPEPARRLGALLLDPALPDLPSSVDRLVIVPDGPLHRLAFEAVTLPDDTPAGARFAIATVPSAAVLLRLRGRGPSERPVELLAMGDPRFAGGDATDSGRSMRLRAAFREAGGLPRLGGSAREVRRIAQYAPQATVLLGSAASETALRREQLTRYRVIHLATHAVVDDHAIERTALALGPEGGNDGFLTAADLAGLRLDADLVVLSACRTAEGILLGNEGIQGLTAPLLEAGARVVLATRWPVGDRHTLAVVEDFYRGLASGLDAGDALRAARRAALARGAPIGEWASFTLIGDPTVRVPLRVPAERGLESWLVATTLAVLALLGARAWWSRRRHRVSTSGSSG